MRPGVQSDDIEPNVKLRKKYRTNWYSIRLRCTDPKHKSYPDYGARGIRLSQAFQDFRTFFIHIKGLSGYGDLTKELDRIDNSLGYQAGNLRFVSRQTNCRNRRSNVRVTYNNQDMCFTEFLEKHAPSLPTTTGERWYSVYKFSLDEIIVRTEARKHV